MKNYTFYRLLHARGISLRQLAEELQTKTSHLSEVFNGKRGAHTRKHIAKLLKPEELAALGWDERGEIQKSSQVRTSSTGNKFAGANN